MSPITRTLKPDIAIGDRRQHPVKSGVGVCLGMGSIFKYRTLIFRVDNDRPLRHSTAVWGKISFSQFRLSLAPLQIAGLWMWKMKKDEERMTIFRSKSGRTALQIIDEITSMHCSCLRLENGFWHHVGNTEPFDPEMSEAALEKMLGEMVENLDKQDFDLSKSIREIPESELPE